MTESQQNSQLYQYLYYNEQAKLAKNELENLAENLFLHAKETIAYLYNKQN